MNQEEFSRLKEIRKELLKLEDEIAYARSATEPRAQALDGMPERSTSCWHIRQARPMV